MEDKHQEQERESEHEEENADHPVRVHLRAVHADGAGQRVVAHRLGEVLQHEQLLDLLDLRGEVLHEDLRPDVGAVVVFVVHAVMSLVAVLAHHDHRRLHGGQD